MRTFREDTERNTVLQYVDRLVYRLLVLLDCTDTVTLAHDRHDFQESKDLGQFRVPEDIGTGHKHLRLEVVGQHHQGIHERIGVVRRKDDRPVLRDILLAYHQNATIGMFDRKTHIVEKRAVHTVVVLYFLYLLAHNHFCLRK